MPSLVSLSFLLILLVFVLQAVLSVGKTTSRTGTGPDSDDGTAEVRNFTIPTGSHPFLKYVDETLSIEEGDLHIKFDTTKRVGCGGNSKAGGGSQVVVYQDVPRYFMDLPDHVVEEEIQYRTKEGRWSDRVVLERFYFCVLYGISGLPINYEFNYKDLQKLEAAKGWEIGDRTSDYCTWEGISCQQKKIKEIRLDTYELKGTLPNDLHLLSDMTRLSLKGNSIRGSIPFTWGAMSNLKSLTLTGNELEGVIPASLSGLTSLQDVWLAKNHLSGTIPEHLMDGWTNMHLLDFSENKLLRGRIPASLTVNCPKIIEIFLEKNQLTGGLPEDTSGLSQIRMFDVGNNKLSGTIPSTWSTLSLLRSFNLGYNRLSGTIPSSLLNLSSMETLILSNNRLTGKIPEGLGCGSATSNKEQQQNNEVEEGKWESLKKLRTLLLNDNMLTGTLPPKLFQSLSSRLKTLDVSSNSLVGTIPTEIGLMSSLQSIQLQNNFISGLFPTEMARLDPNLALNLTGNLLTGTVPKSLCKGGANSVHLLYRQFGCDAVLCPPGTFHPYGAATLHAGCRPCQDVTTSDDGNNNRSLRKVLGRTKCDGIEFVHGDLNGDGILSPREILRLLYVYTAGQNWGAQFMNWADPKIAECDLNGVVCLHGRKVAKIDLTDAAFCTNGERKAGVASDCHGLPSELALLTDLEVLSLNRRQFLRGTIPTEFGQFRKLKYLDISLCPSMTGTLPTELGELTNMKFLNLSGCRFNGTVPEELFRLTNLEKLHLSMNTLTGTLSPDLGNLRKLKELMFSRTQVSGSIPEEIGDLTSIENLEMYGNQFTGTIPSSLGNCTNLKRVDLFNNRLVGTIPETLTGLQSLQIIHAKLNQLTGTISHKFGELPFLSWFDVSSNRLHGTIPATFGFSRSIKDFRLGGNMIHDPIPQSLCSNTNINGGMTRMYGCDGVICPLGTYSEPGHATHSDGCKPCPEGLTTMYLGSVNCEEITDQDILSIFFDVMGGQKWDASQKENWKKLDVSVCDWSGITCDETGEIVSIRFPLLGAGDAEF